MIEQSITELASGSISVAALLYNAFETPITLLLGVLSVGIIFGLIVRAFIKQ